MPEWFDRAFGATADVVGAVISDARSKLIDEAWFGRRVPELREAHGLGWRLSDHPSAEPQQPSPEQERGIDR